jgi:hypothetical protein
VREGAVLTVELAKLTVVIAGLALFRTTDWPRPVAALMGDRYFLQLATAPDLQVDPPTWLWRRLAVSVFARLFGRWALLAP